jgi:hypothetical protein
LAMIWSCSETGRLFSVSTATLLAVVRLLCGGHLAPNGVCHAASLTRGPVSSYLTVSPLPACAGGLPDTRQSGIRQLCGGCFLWHFPSSLQSHAYELF